MTRHFTTWVIALAAIAVMGISTASAQDVYLKGGGISDYHGAPNYPLISGFDSMEEDTTLWGQYGFWDENNDCTNQGPPCWDFYEGERDYAILYDYATELGGTDHPQGASALYIDWGVFSDNSWGGSSAMQHALPDSLIELGYFYDFSDFLEIGLDYNTQVPTGESAAFRIKINEASEGTNEANGGFEDWYSESRVMLEDTPGWKEVFIPLETADGCCGDGGFNRPGWSGVTGNDTFDTDKIAGFQLEFVAPSSASQGDSLVSGTVIWDNFRVRGVRYNLMSDFEGDPTGHGKQSNAGTYTLSNSSDAVLGDASLQADYNIVGDQGWGGELDLFFSSPDGEAMFVEMAQQTAVTVFYKVLEPASAGGTFSLRVYEASDGNEEIWEYSDGGCCVMTEDSGQWRRFLAPFREMSIPSWSTTHDGILDQNAITQIQFVLYIADGTTTTGSILFDRMTGYGFQETDNTAPEAPAGVAAITTEYANLVNWTDVPGEDGETYTIYVSESPITDVTASGVTLLVEGVEEGNEVWVHDLYYPNANGEVTLYYAISATDAVGNAGAAAGMTASVTNTAKGIPTIAMGGPAGFAADGDLTEWAGIVPFRMEAGTDFGFVGLGSGEPAASDLSADMYLAMDAENFYFAAEVTDDVIDSWTGTGNHYEYDEFQLYIGLWDRNANYHSGNRGGAPLPDYEISMVIGEALTGEIPGWDDGNNPKTGDGRYSWTNTPGGYNLELVVSFADMQRDGQDVVFTPQEGMRIPIDVSLHDDDTADGLATQDLILTLSSTNGNNAWQDVTLWLSTWIGNAYSVGIEQVDVDLPQQFNLEPNYPNPFNPTTMFRYELPESGGVTLRIFNLLGQEVHTLVDRVQAAGTYEVRFDASGLASGMYLYQLQSGSFVQTRTMMLVR